MTALEPNGHQAPHAVIPKNVINDLFREVATSLQAISNSEYAFEVAAAIELVVRQFRSGNKLLVFGNGGSSADAQHICAELVGRFMKERRGLPAIALSSNEAVLTAWGNDYGFESVFERQISAYGLPGDVAWGISTSGNSANVVKALVTARTQGLYTLGLTGGHGGRMVGLCDVSMTVPLSDTPRIQEIHVITYHAICAAVEDALFADA